MLFIHATYAVHKSIVHDQQGFVVCYTDWLRQCGTKIRRRTCCTLVPSGAGSEQCAEPALEDSVLAVANLETSSDTMALLTIVC